MKRKIHRRCKCYCGGITNLGRKYIRGHHLFGNMYTLGYKPSEKAKLKMSLSSFKCNPNRKYCDAWLDMEYKNDLRKDCCENADCKKKSTRLCNHHINLNKKDCRPINIITLCYSCHLSLHLRLLCQRHKLPTAILKDYIIINRSDHISYIHKKLRKVIVKIDRRGW